MTIRMKTYVIGNFEDGSLKFGGKKLRFKCAAIVKFETEQDAQAFAQRVNIGEFKDYELADAPQPAVAEFDSTMRGAGGNDG